VKDTSGGCGAAFEVFVVSEKFQSVPLIDRHRMVTDALKGQGHMDVIHAIKIKAWTPEKYAQEQQKS